MKLCHDLLQIQNGTFMTSQVTDIAVEMFPLIFFCEELLICSNRVVLSLPKCNEMLLENCVNCIQYVWKQKIG
jgi:hypothetical protein